jgi:hypothetical protein
VLLLSSAVRSVVKTRFRQWLLATLPSRVKNIAGAWSASEIQSTNQNPNPGGLRLSHYICRPAAGESNHEIRSAFGQHACIAKQNGPTAKRSRPHVKHLRRDTARLRPFNGERTGATGAPGDDGTKAVFGVKAIELRMQLGAISVVTAAAD